MNQDKENMIKSWRLRSYLYFIVNGFRQIKQSKLAIIITVIYWLFVLFIIFITVVSSSRLTVIADTVGNSFFLVLIYLVFALFAGKPRCARKDMKNFIRIGLHNHAYETPLLMDADFKENNYILKFRNCGLPLSKWNDLKESIETVLNLNILSIEEQGKKWIIVTAVSGDIVLPSCIEWNDTFISHKNFELVLGESYYGKVIINLANTPHLLIGGSTGSGKTILLKNLLFQCYFKGAKLFVADFKGGVDFPRNVWHDKCSFITEKADLIHKLNKLVTELRYRRELFANSDCANIDNYNKKYHRNLRRIIFACDEVAEMLDKTGLSKEQKQEVAEIEAYISTIARLGRAFGIHLILATQRPDANVISGQIKNNIDVRICGRADDILSQIILDNTNANDKIPKNGRGRFLTNSDILFQGYWFDDNDI